MTHSNVNKFLFFAKNLWKEMWVKCSIYCLSALLPFFFGPTLIRFIPASFLEIVSTDALQKILVVMASSLLAVTTFSLSIMVQAFHTVANTTTPRASKLLMQDRIAQNALGAFIGSFLFSIVGIVGLSSELYKDDIVDILFFLTLLMILIVIVMLLQWIRQLSNLGRVSVTIQLIEDELRSGIHAYVNDTVQKISEMKMDQDELEASTQPVEIKNMGYIQYIDYSCMSDLAEEHDFQVYLNAMPGDFVDSQTVFLFVSRYVDKKITDRLVKSIIIDKERTLAQDPRYGFLLLTEVVLRALSPGMNDTGTAIDAIHTQMRVFEYWINEKETCNASHRSDPTEGQKHVNQETTKTVNRVQSKTISVGDIMENVYFPILEDAKSSLLFCKELQRSFKVVESLCKQEDKAEVAKWSKYFEKILQIDLRDDQLEGLSYINQAKKH